MKKTWKEQKDFLVNLSSLFQKPKKGRKNLLNSFLVLSLTTLFFLVIVVTPLLGDCCSKCHHKTAGSITMTAILTVTLNLVIVVR